MKSVERNRVVTLTFQTSKIYQNPIKDCMFEVTFTHQNLSIKREAFWDGDNIYRVSFAPTALGEWKYHVRSTDQKWDGHVGEVYCEEYQGDLEIYKHGFLKVGQDHHFMTYGDGTPFFWLGDTHWEFAYREEFDHSSSPLFESQFKSMVDLRKRQGFNVYQTNLRSDPMMGGQIKYWDENGLPNILFYQEELDRRMAYIADQGFVNALGLAWFMSIENNLERYQELARYIIARYGAYPMVYTLAGEVGGYNKEKQQYYVDEWRKVMDVIVKYDSYHQLHTAHYTNERPFPTYYQDEAWLDFTLNQAGHGDYVISANDYISYLSKHDDKPFIEGEAFYEFCSTLEENGTRMVDAAMLRRVAYMTIQTGGAGYTYGAQGIWDNVLKKGTNNRMSIFNQFDVTWYEAILGEGATQMGYMKQFYLNENFTTLFPYKTEQTKIGNPFGKKLPLITHSLDKTHWVFYYPASTRSTITISGFNNAIYELQWFDVRTGQYSEPERILIENEWKIREKPTREDYCLVLKQVREE